MTKKDVLEQNELINRVKKLYEMTKKHAHLLITVILVFLFALEIVLFCRLNTLKQVQKTPDQVPAVQQAEQKPQVQYVYNPNLLIQNFAALKEAQADFEKKINDLNVKVDDSRKKLDSMKDEKAKKEYATVYISSLTLQRDQAVEEYQNKMKNFDQQINQALVQVVNENGLPYVFDSRSVVVTTPYVVDITGAVLQKLQ